MKHGITDAEFYMIQDLRQRGFAVIATLTGRADPRLVEAAMGATADGIIEFVKQQDDEPSDLMKLCRDLHCDSC